MKKSFLFSLLTVCTINSALAENIQSIDTPVNWSVIALDNTVSHFHPNPEHYVDIVVETYHMIINVHNGEFIATPREMHAVYSVMTENIAQEPVFYYLFIERLKESQKYYDEKN